MSRVDHILDDLVGEVERPGRGTARAAGVGTPHVVATTNCRNCGAPPSAGVGACRYCGTPHSVTTPTTRDRTAPRRILD